MGLEAQRKVIEDFAVSRGAEVLAQFAEVESGRKADRPELAKALHLSKVTGATLVIAKLARLSRNAALLLALRDSGVRFVADQRGQAGVVETMRTFPEVVHICRCPKARHDPGNCPQSNPW